jgi:6-phosphogluconate dehydrogenase
MTHPTAPTSALPPPCCVVGILGLGLLSRNLILAIARHGFPVAGYDSDPGRRGELQGNARGLPVTVCHTLQEFTTLICPPRSILILVQGGPGLEATFHDLGEFLEPGDLIIDAVSYHHLSTPRRRTFFAGRGVHFLSTGIGASGHGHEYCCRALYPELQEICRRIRPLFQVVATMTPGEPCVTFVGRQIERQLGRLEGVEAAP